MLNVKTNSGFKCKIDEKIVNKYSFVRLMAKIEKDPSAIVDLISLLLGSQEEKLIEHLGGDPSIEEMSSEIASIFEAMKENNEVKKS